MIDISIDLSFFEDVIKKRSKR